MPNTSHSLNQRGFENLSSLLDDEHDSLQDMVQRRLNTAVAKRRLDRTAKFANEPAKSSRPKQLDPREMLDLLGQLNRPESRVALPAM